MAPNAPAVSCREVALTYGELGALADGLARHLRTSFGVRAGDRVALCLHPRCELLASILAIMRLGAVYVPLDPTHPPAHTRFILEETRPTVVLTESAVTTLDGIDGLVVANWDGLHEVLSAAASDGDVEGVDAPDLGREAPCYLIFTSGTTGKPKGVVASLGNLEYYLGSARARYGFGPSDRFCSIARTTFSISLFELLSPLACGASVRLLRRDDVLTPSVLGRELEDVSVLHAGPSLLSGLFRYMDDDPTAPRAFPAMRHASSGGDLVQPHVMERMKTVFPNAELFVIYGCTEISCMGCTYEVRRDVAASKTYVGRPFEGVRVSLLDEAGGTVPEGEIGEICFAGPGLALGYLDRPEVEAEKFFEHEGSRFYKTGDLGRTDATGYVEMLGRRDFQVQLRGMRVEVLGIESLVVNMGLASQCAVALVDVREGDKRLVAFVVHPTASTKDIRHAIADHMPDYMVPAHVVELDALPLTVNGKLDRRALATQPVSLGSEGSDKTAPRSAAEQQAVAAFTEVLRTPVGIDDDFFDLGGHSLLVVQLAAELENKMGLVVPPALLFEASTVRTIVERLQGSDDSTHRPIRLSRGTEAPALFLVAGMHVYRQLARHLEGAFTVYGVFAGAEFDFLEGGASEAKPVPELAAQYVELIQRQQAHGPYRVGGLSYGGIVAYEVARQLRAAGEVVEEVILLDAMLPERGPRARARQLLRLVTLERGIQARVVSSFAEKAVEKIRARLGGRFRKTPRHHEFVEQQSEELNRMEVDRLDAYQGPADAYSRTVVPSNVPVRLVVAGKRAALTPIVGLDCGWQPYVRELDVQVVDAEHLDLLREPHVEQVARALTVRGARA